MSTESCRSSPLLALSYIRVTGFEPALCLLPKQVPYQARRHSVPGVLKVKLRGPKPPMGFAPTLPGLNGQPETRTQNLFHVTEALNQLS